MIEYINKPKSVLSVGRKQVFNFVSEADLNIDEKTVQSFGEEWETFHGFAEEDISQIGKDYFDIVTEEHVNKTSLVLDVGCGSGRWSKFLAHKVNFIEAIDPSDAVYSAVQLTQNIPNIRITKAGVDSIPFSNNSFDFVFSLGVLHHIPDTKAAMQCCVDKLKPKGYFLVYLYYSLDNRKGSYKLLFQIVNAVRRMISKLPSSLKKFVCDLIAITIYWPLSRFSLLVRKFGFRQLAKKIPLSYYGDKSFYIMRNDALDRFGTPLEQRFSKVEIERIMTECGLTDIIFSNSEPYWHAIGKKK
jgi:2-polyprenyl-3-methyl-5-hydroxy-6-metoxy-1,4-benzoquinol methylase